MDARTLEKINNLAKSLKENRLAANMDEAVAMAKGMLTKDPSGNPVTPQLLDEMSKDLDSDKKELNELAGETEALKMDAHLAKEREEPQAAVSHQHSKDFEQISLEVKEAKDEVHALQDIKKDSKDALKKEEEAFQSEEKSDDDLPGEH